MAHSDIEARPIYFSDEEVSFLVDLLDMWNEGIPEAHQATIEDKSLTKLDDLMKLSSGYAEQEDLIKSIKEKICPK